jgi:tetratricopeptide (TPR) repeat protein
LTSDREAMKGGAPNEEKVIPVSIPQAAAKGFQTNYYRIRVKICDEKDNEFSSESTKPVAVNIEQCIEQALRRAVEVHEKGNPTAAIEKYNSVVELRETVGEGGTVSELMAKTYFDRGLAHLQSAMSSPQDDPKWIGNMVKAGADLGLTIRHHSRDAEALYLRALVSYLKGDYKEAIEDLNSAIVNKPGMAEAFALRAKTHLQMRKKSNLDKAVDDFTEALILKPENASWRSSRKKALALAVQSAGKPGKTAVDISSVPLDSAEEVEPGKLLRK